MDKKEFDINNMTISSTIVKNVSKWKENVLESAVESWNRNRDKNQEWFPMTDILLHDKGEYKNALVVVPFANDQQKSMMMKCLKEFCIEFKAIGFSLMTEVWMVILDTKDRDTDNYESGIKKVSKHKDRIECFIVSLETTHETELHTYEIIRDDNKEKSPYLRKMNSTYPSKIEGSMMHILSKDINLNLN